MYAFIFFTLKRDKEFGFQLYQSDPAGNYTGWKVKQCCKTKKHSLTGHNFFQATAIGNNCQSAHALLKAEYSDTMSHEEARALILKTLKKSMDKTQLLPENLELLELTCDTSQNVKIRTIHEDEISITFRRINQELEK